MSFSERFLIRGTRGSGPPPDLAFREVAYSDTDGLIHVGRPNGGVRSFGEGGGAGTPGPQGPQGPQGIPGVALTASGAWTPAYVMSTSGSVTPNLALGDYFLLGDLVIFSATLRSSALVSPVGSVRISLPFPAAISGAEGWSISIAPASWGTAMPDMRAIINTPQAITLTKNATNSPVATVVAADLAGASNSNLIRLSGWYRRTP